MENGTEQKEVSVESIIKSKEVMEMMRQMEKLASSVRQRCSVAGLDKAFQNIIEDAVCDAANPSEETPDDADDNTEDETREEEQEDEQEEEVVQDERYISGGKMFAVGFMFGYLVFVLTLPILLKM